MKKITLIIAGGVSLGAFEAGAVTELLYAIEQYHRKNQRKAFEIDVITGASAGSIIGALTGKILSNYEKLKGILHEAWVKKADIKELMKCENPLGVLSNELLYTLTDQYLQNDIPLAPVNATPKTLKLVFSLASQVGTDYGIPYGNPEQRNGNNHFSSTFFSESISFNVNYEENIPTTVWKKLATSAIASGSFPLIFPPVGIKREKEDYAGAIFNSLSFLPNMIHYIDGGIFNNEPLKWAIQKSTEQDHGILSDDRIFILIDPNLGASLQDTSFTEPQPFHKNAFRLIKQIMGESQGKDWLKMDGINTKIEWKDRYVARFPSFINSLEKETLEEELASTKAQIEEILEKKPNIPLRDCFKKIRNFYADSFRALTNDIDLEKKNMLLEQMIFILNHVANLDQKYPLEFYVISSETDQTGGDPYFSFGGFFKEEWREHDFRFGRREAYQLLPTILKIPPYPKEPDADYENDPEWGNISSVTIADAPIIERKLFADRITKKFVSLVKHKPLELRGIKLMIAKMAFKGVIKSSLKIKKSKWYNPFSWFKN